MQRIKRLWGIVAIVIVCLFCHGCSRNDKDSIHDSSSHPGTGGTDEIDTDSSTQTSSPSTVKIRLTFDETKPPLQYFVTAVLNDGKVVRAVCGNNTSATDVSISCTPFGAQLTNVVGDFHLTVKARAYSFISTMVSPATLETEDAIRIYAATLDVLAPFETAQWYRTGFAEGEMEAFIEMAYETKSETGAVDAVKFIVMNPHTQPVVYFMNTKQYPMHYYFARDVLGMTMSSTEFTTKVYAEGDREFMAGTIMFHDTINAECERLGHPIVRPFVLGFYPSDNVSVSQARLVHRLVEERLGVTSLVGQSHRLFYQPAAEQKEVQLSQSVELFDQWDASWVLRWEIYRQKSWQIMNTGVAYGTLRLADLDALESEAFSFKDIVVLPTLPIALPIVGGSITEEFQTPLSHVNVMAKNRGTPNMTLTAAVTNPDISGLFGKLVRFEVSQDGYTLKETTIDEAEAFWASVTKEPITLESDLAYSELPLLADIGFSDWICVGAKAANLAELHQLLGEKAPKGFAVPFYYYQEFMDFSTVDAALCTAAQSDCISENREAEICTGALLLCTASVGETLTAYVDTLLDTENFLLDTQLREATLAGLRYLIVEGNTEPNFAQKLDARVAEVFGANKARLRSSTNTEDIPGFSGAGLYDSKSAYAQGSSSASTIIRKIWASVWNWRAFEERSFWNIDHRSTRMGVAVNQSFGEEAANGVLITQNIENPTLEGMYVNLQLGEISVTNPEGMYTPEIFTIIRGTQVGTVQPARLSYSSLSPGKSIMTDKEITALHESAMIVQNHFAALYNISPYKLALDMEFKLLAGDRALMIKQARPYAY